MKNTAQRIISLLLLLLTLSLGVAPDALAAIGTRTDHSGIFVWGFLALCSLIILAQILPLLMELLRQATEMQDKRKMVLGAAHHHHREKVA